MPGQLKCNSCGGTYPDTTKGGVSYFHACPDPRIKTHAVCDPATDNVITPAVFEPMPNPRNENLVPDPANAGKFIMAAPGAGVTPI